MRSPMQIQSFLCHIDTGHLSAILTDKANIPDQAFGKILFQGTPEELAANQIVREKYLSNSFVLRRKDFQLEK